MTELIIIKEMNIIGYVDTRKGTNTVACPDHLSAFYKPETWRPIYDTDDSWDTAPSCDICNVKIDVRVTP
jgi:hypothetical protein